MQKMFRSPEVWCIFSKIAAKDADIALSFVLERFLSFLTGSIKWAITPQMSRNRMTV